MPARPKIATILAVALMVSLVLGACGGGSTGKTWFNLPSVKVRLQPDGTARVLGFNAGYILAPAMIQQMQGAGVQQAEVRIGYEGIFIFINGETLPYIEWSEEAVETLQNVLVNLPTVPNGQQIANALPWLRTIGLGVKLIMPGAPVGPVWNGVEPVIAEGSGGAPTIGPIVLGSLVFDPQGNAIIEGVPASTLEQALGMPLPLSLDANTLAILQGLGAQAVRVMVTPTGVDLTLNDRPLPDLQYNADTLGRLGQYAGAFMADTAMLDQIIPLLTSLQLEVAVSFTGEQIAETQLPALSVAVQPDGTLQVFGIPAGTAPIVPADVLQNLQSANVQHLSIDLGADGLVLAANDQVLPTISWTDESLQTLANLAAPLAGVSPDLINTALGIVRGTGLEANVSLPLAEGATAIEIPEEIDTTMEPAALDGSTPPVIHVRAAFDDQQITSIGNVSAADLASLGINLPSLPPALGQTLDDMGVSEVRIQTEANVLNILLDGNTALTINYDTPSLVRTLEIAAPFLGESPLTNEAVSKLLTEQILRLAPGTDLDITLVAE